MCATGPNSSVVIVSAPGNEGGGGSQVLSDAVTLVKSYCVLPAPIVQSL